MNPRINPLEEDKKLEWRKLAIVFVIDVSESMSEYLFEITRKFNEFIDYLKMDNDLNTIVDLTAITFGSDVKDEFGFSKVEFIPELNLSCRGLSKMKKALSKARELIYAKIQTYRKNGIVPYRPWIILITGGKPDEPIDDIATILRDDWNAGKLRMISVGVGANVNKNTLKLISDKIIAIKGQDFEIFFSWLEKSILFLTLYGGHYLPFEEYSDMGGTFFDVV